MRVERGFAIGVAIVLLLMLAVPAGGETLLCRRLKREEGALHEPDQADGHCAGGDEAAKRQLPG